MSSKFITNDKSDRPLSEIIRSLTEHSSKLDFLVGYFFFSGFCEIHEQLKDKPLRILIGMDAEVDLHNCICEYTTISKGDRREQKLAVRTRYFEKLQKIINKSDVLDEKRFKDSYETFLKKLDDGTLEIRKTKDPNHAKMYLFNIPKGVSGTDDSKVIVGSSNFSIQGFKARNEVNVYLQDGTDYKDAEKIFNDLWKDAIPLVGKENKDDLIDCMQHTWLEVRPEPYLVYLRVLYEYFKATNDHVRTPREITRDSGNQFLDVSYQIDAIREGVAKIKKHSGVIVADVVGLGKSVIAAAIAANLDKRTVIITPPHLLEQWKAYAFDFGLRGATFYTSGKLEDAADENEGASDLVVIIDEAHRYRNEWTEAYSNLSRLCAGNKVILLSATPFNNEPSDIFSMIKLFQIPEHSTIQTVNNLGEEMKALIFGYDKLKKEHRAEKMGVKEFNDKSKELADKIRGILDPVVIRRTRIDLEKSEKYKADLKANGIEFSNVLPPQSQKYELGELSELYINTLDALTGNAKKGTKGSFNGTRYKPLLYLKRDETGKIDPKLIKKYSDHLDAKTEQMITTGQKNMAVFMRQLLVRRFESSQYSFKSSLKNIKESMEVFRKSFLDYGKIPMTKRLPDIDELVKLLGDDDNLDQIKDSIETSGRKREDIWFVDAADLSDDFLKELESDMTLFDDFIQQWEQVDEDPKFKSIENNIKESLRKDPKRKIIIFSEFSDTAEYIADKFKTDGMKVLMYSSKNAGKGKQNEVKENFDAGLAKDKQKNDYEVLVATDAISEGFNLHRAGTIYNYDIPYNPTRVIQRVGRINRINKKVFDELYIYNFFPSAIGEEISHTAEISTFKMKLFQAIFGADTKILTDDETIDGYLRKQFDEAEEASNSLSWQVEFENELSKIESENPDLLEMAKNLPQRCRVARKNVDLGNVVNQDFGLYEELKNKGVLLFSKKGDAPRFCFASRGGGARSISQQQALSIFRATQDEKGEEVSDDFYMLYEAAKENSGIISKTSAKYGKNVQEVRDAIQAIMKEVSDYEKGYLEALRQVILWGSISEGDIKRILKEIGKKSGEELVPAIKHIIPDYYLDAIIQKESNIVSEPETILLAEELL
ncbi:hypothetical protein J5834_00840 [bacterium]|nr:hypothetical protein [bacterium]